MVQKSNALETRISKPKNSTFRAIRNRVNRGMTVIIIKYNFIIYWLLVYFAVLNTYSDKTPSSTLSLSISSVVLELEAVSARLSLKLWSSASRLSGTNDGVMLSAAATRPPRLFWGCCGSHNGVALLGLKLDGFFLV